MNSQTSGNSLRHRVNVARTTKGAWSWECTVEGEGYTRDEILAEHDAVVAELKRRYPATSDRKEGE